jgi:hypothetical protein
VKPRLYGTICLVAAPVGVAATVYFWIFANPETGIVFAVLTLLLLPAWLLYSAAWRRRNSRR